MNLIVMYPGRFQPWHAGHMSTYQNVKNLFEEYGGCKIVSTDKVDERSPFNFEEKRVMMQHTGVPLQDIVQVKSPYTASEVLQNYDGKDTAIVFIISKKDMEDDPRFSLKPQKSGKPSYFQIFRGNIDKLEPFGDPMKPARAYLLVQPVVKFWFGGAQMNSASQIRELFPQLGFKEQKWLITELYGTYSEQVHDLWQKRLLNQNHMPLEKSKPNSSMSASLIKNSDQCWTPLSAMPLLS